MDLIGNGLEKFGFTRKSTQTTPPLPGQVRRLRSSDRPMENNNRDRGQSAESTIKSLQATLGKRDEQLRISSNRLDELTAINNGLHTDRTRLEIQISEQEYAHEDVENRYQYVVDVCISPYAQQRNFPFNGHEGRSLEQVTHSLYRDAVGTRSLRADLRASQVAIKPLKKHLEAAQHKVRNLQRQINTLQTELLSRVEKFEVLSDEDIGSEFRSLAASIKALSRAVRCSKDMSIADLRAGLLQNVSQHHWRERGREKYFIEAWIWSVLFSSVFANPFSVFGSQYKSVANAWLELFGSVDPQGWPEPTIASESWRYTTVGRLAGLSDEATNAVDHNPSRAGGGSIFGMMRAMVISVMGVYLESKSNQSPDTQISAIVDRAFALVRRMGMQRSRIQITCPTPGAAFVKEEMSSMPDLDGDDVTDGFVAFIVTPGLTKWGDASGKNFDQRYDIVLASVQLEAQSSVVNTDGFPDLYMVEESGAADMGDDSGLVKLESEHPAFRVEEDLGFTGVDTELM